MIYYLLCYLADRRYRYVPSEQALRDVRAGLAVLDKMVLEADTFVVRHITRPEERRFYEE